jgi:RimJ/RimL family protein N-acetyltransferase
MIETERLLLRNWGEGDGDLLHRHCNTRMVMRWLGGVQSRGRMLEVAARLRSWQDAYGHTFWVVERKSDGEFLGFCGLKRADGSNSSVTGEIEIGWRLREDAWGQGYAREAASASLDFAFGKLDTDRVIALTVDGNSNSWGLMERLGMIRRSDLDYSDPEWPSTMNPVIVYELEREAWRR